MTANGYLQLAFYVVVLVALAKPLGALHGARVRRVGPTAINRFRRRRSSASSTGSAASIRDARCTGLSTRSAVLAFNVLGLLVVYALQRLQACCRSIRRHMAAVSPDSAFNTAVSFATNTNWQGYGGETTMSYLTQMLGLAVQNFVSAATGMAVLVAFIRGFAAHVGADDRQLLGRPRAHRRSISCCRCRSSLALVLVSQGVVQTFSAYQTVELVQPVTYDNPRSTPPASRSRTARQSGHRAGYGDGADDRARSRGLADRDQAARHQRRRLLQRQQRASVREPDAAVELPRVLVDPADLRRRSASPSARWSQRHAPGLGRARGDDDRLRRDCSPVACAGPRAAGNPAACAASASTSGERHAIRRQHGRQGNALRHRRIRAVGDGDDGRVEWLGQFDARFLHAARRAGADVADPARRGDLRRRRLGPLRHARVRDHRRVRRRTDGRAHAGVPRQEDRGLRDEDGDRSSILVPPFARARRHARSPCCVPAGRRSVANPGAHGFTEILYAFSSAGNNNGSAFAGLNANTPFYNVVLGVAMWFGALSAVIVPVLAIAGSLAAKKRMPAGAGTLPTHTPLFVVLLVGDRAARRRAHLRPGARARSDRRAADALRRSRESASPP